MLFCSPNTSFVPWLYELVPLLQCAVIRVKLWPQQLSFIGKTIARENVYDIDFDGRDLN